MIQRWLVAFGLWLARLGGWIAPPCTRAHLDVPPTLAGRIMELALEQHASPTSSGEAKRHQVYARLLKDFPNMPHRQVALAIEVVLSGG